MSPEEVIDLALERYERPLIGYARSITGDPESARDAVQETFLRLSRQNLAALERRLAPWLFFVCRARPCAKDRAVHRWSGRRGAPGGKSQPCGGGRNPSEESARLRWRIDQLPQQQREMIQLKFDARLSYKEIGEAMRISVSSVGVQLHAAIQTLRRLWKRENTGVIS
jgi:RNA polymerase sigma-70 factor (ECF subfamily)